MNQAEATKAIPGIFVNAIANAIFVKLWFIWAIFALFILVKFILRYLEKQKLSEAGLSDIDTMNGRRFEKYLVTLFEGLGYKVELTKFKGDYGGDLVVSKDRVKTVVQAKRYKKKVGVKAIQEAVAAKGYYNCDNAMVVTNSRYTDQAKLLANKNSVSLWDRADLIENLLKVKKDKTVKTKPVNTEQLEPEPVAASSRMSFDEIISDKCVACGKTVSEKVKKYCLDNAQRFKDKLYCFNCQKSII